MEHEGQPVGGTEVTQHSGPMPSIAARTGFRPAVIWFTGIPGAGKSTLAVSVGTRLRARNVPHYVLDADQVRRGLNSDLGFSDAHRNENVRRMAHVAALLADAGLVVLVACIAPFAADRTRSRELIGERYWEVFVDLPQAIAESRDPKGLYARARRGELTSFTGVDSDYERPDAPDVRIDTSRFTASEAAEEVMEHLSAWGILDPGEAWLR